MDLHRKIEISKDRIRAIHAMLEEADYSHLGATADLGWTDPLALIDEGGY